MVVASAAGQSVLRLGSNVVLARLLAPDVFALTAITFLVLTSIHMISDVGIAITALREGQMNRADEDRLWTMQAMRGVGVSVLVAATAVPVSWIYGDPLLRDMLFALALTPVLDGAKSLYPTLELARRRLLPSTLVELGGRLVSILLSIAIAVVSPTVWAVVIGTILATICSTVASHVMSGRWPRFVLDRAYIARQWRFSRWIQASSTLTFAGAQIDKALFPFLFGLPLLGIYGIAAGFASMPSQVTQRWSANVFYPLAVEMLRGDAAARARLMTVRTTMLLYSFIATLAVMAVAPSFFLLLYAPRYHAAAGLAIILGAGTFFEIGEGSLRHFPLVEGTPQFEVWTVVARLAAFALGALVVVLTTGGVAAYALCYVGGLAASHLFMLAVCVRRGYLRPGLDLLLIAALAAGGALIYRLPFGYLHVLGLLASGAIIGIGATGLICLVFLRRGLPSMPVEAAPEALREAAAEDDGVLRPDAV